MDQITKLYYNKAVSLQEKYDRLFATYKKLMEDSSSRAFGEAGEDIYKILEVGEDATPEQIKKAHRAKILKYHPDVVKNLPEAERLAAENQFKRLQTAYEIASDPSSTNAMDYREGRKNYSASQQPKTSAEPKAKQPSPQKPEAKPSPQAAPKPQPQPQPEPKTQTQPKLQLTAKPQPEAKAQSTQANSKPGAAKPKTTGTVVKPSKVSSPVGVKAAEIGKSVGRGLGSFGAGWLGYDIGRAAGQKAAEMAGIESETAKEVAGEVAGGAAGGVAATTASSLMGKALPTLGNLAKAAGTGALVSGVAYGALKVGEKIGTEIGETEIGDGRVYSDVMGKDIYDKYLKLTGRASSDEQLNTKKTGVAGGVPAINQQIAAEEQAEEEAKTRKATEKEARIQQKLQRLKDEAAKQGS